MGGIGCGKTAVTDRLARRGAAVVDADVIAREVVEPGSPALEELVSAFGSQILSPDGALDRAAMADRAFGDESATATMNAILHPAIGVELASQIATARARHEVVVVAIPLFRAEHRDALGADVVVCVDCDPELAVERLIEHRGFSEHDARRRISAQRPREERRAMADVVIDNTGDLAALDVAVDALWDELAPS